MHGMKSSYLVVLISSLGIIALTGCAAFNKVSLTYEKTTTTGKELLDLKAAKDAGILSDAEYTKLRDQIIKTVTNLMTVGCCKVK